MQVIFRSREFKDRCFEASAKCIAIFMMIIFLAFISLIFLQGVGAFYSSYLRYDKKSISEIGEKLGIDDGIIFKEISEMISPFSQKVIQDNNLLKLASKYDQYIKYRKSDDKFLSDSSLLIDNMLERDLINLNFDMSLLKGKDSSYPENAGISISIIGSLLTVSIALITALPLGIICGVYLEEFGRNGIVKNIIDININNLASIPSIIYGLFGLFIFIYSWGLPRSSCIVAGLTMSFMMLPIIVMTTKQSLNYVPNHIRYAALALGATKSEMVLHHILPIAFPRIITGIILATARIFGETAPLILLGSVAFIINMPENLKDPVGLLPTQIYLWSSNIEAGYTERMFGAIIILVSINLIIYYFANYFKNKYEHKN